MNNLLTKIGFIALFIGSSFTANAHVALDYPVGGETFVIGQTVNIQWHVLIPHNTLNWDLYYSPDGGVTWDTIVLDIPVDQFSYEWEIPDETTAQGRIRVKQDNVGQDYQDDCMNFSIVPNTSPPSLDAPASDITIECNPNNQEAAIQAWLDDHGGAAATNYCGELGWTNDYAGYTNDCGGTGNTIVIFEAADACGMITTNATLTIADTSPPEIELSATSLTVESDGQGNHTDLINWLNADGGASATDACGQVIWTNNFSALSDDCGSTGSALVTFTATDDCGNNNSAIATFTIQDHTPPAINVVAQNKTIVCSASDQQNEIQQWLNTRGGAQGSDAGGEIFWTNNYAGLSDGCGSTGAANVIFMATDQCGNTATTTATITIEDHVTPAITQAAQNMTLECTGTDQQNEIQLWLDSHAGAQGSDGCSNISWSNNFNGLSDGCGATGAAIVIFTATDECGNNSTTVATISIEDRTAPVINADAHDTTVVCGVDDQSTAIQNWINRQGGAQATDICGNVTWTNDFTTLPDTCGPVGSHNAVFTATDECGNTVTTNAILTIVDTVITSIKHPEELHFTIYPNPASDFLKVTFDKINVQQIILSLFDPCGKSVWSDESIATEISIPLNNYPAGVYFLQIKSVGNIYTRKVIIH